MEKNTEYVAQGQFNQAYFEQIRLNDIMKEVNLASINPLAWNEVYCEYNYIVVFRSLNTYYGEVKTKFSDKENVEIDKLKNTIQKVMDGYDIFLKGSGPRSLNRKDVTKIDKKIWVPLREGLSKYQYLILKYAHKHGLGNPTKSDPSKAIIN